MKFYQLAFRYLYRKRSKTVLLFCVLLFVNSMVLSTNMILRTTKEAKAAIQAKSNAKVVVEVIKENQTVTNEEIEQLKQMDGVLSFNRLSSNYAYLVNGRPITNRDASDVENQTITLSSYDDLSKDSAFYEDRYRIIEGECLQPEDENKVVMSASLALANNLKLGDEIAFETIDGSQATTVIVGLFQSHSESKQDNIMASRYRIENQVFLDQTTYASLFEAEGYDKVVIYSSQPEQLDELQIQVEELLGEKVSLTTSDALFKQMVAPLNQIIKVTSLILTLSFITGILVVSLMLCMWMKGRQKEIAIFISMGKSKAILLVQVLLESYIVFFCSILGACGLGSWIANVLQSILSVSDIDSFVLQVTLHGQDILTLLATGGILIGAAVCTSLCMVIRSNPKDTLAKMEG